MITRFMVGEPVENAISHDVGEVVGVISDERLIVSVDSGDPEVVFWPQKVAVKIIVNDELDFFAGEIADALGGMMTSASLLKESCLVEKCEIVNPIQRAIPDREQYVETLLVRRYGQNSGFRWWHYSRANGGVVYCFVRKE